MTKAPTQTQQAKRLLRLSLLPLLPARRRSSLRIDRHHRSLGHRWTWCRSAKIGATLKHIREMTDESPFARPTVMVGYPLDPAEKTAVEHALSEVRHARSNGDGRESQGPAGSDGGSEQNGREATKSVSES